MTPTIDSLIARCFAVGLESGHEYERLPWDLCCDLVRYGLDDDPADPHDRPGDGIGVLCMELGVANKGVKWPEGFAAPADPAGADWSGVRAQSGKHWTGGTRKGKPNGGGGLSGCDLDSGGLVDAYEAHGWPGPRDWYVGDGRPRTYDALRNENGKAWRAFQDWADALYESDVKAVKAGQPPPFACWVVHYWLREFWFPAWREAYMARRNAAGEDWPAVADSAALGARFRNSAKGAAAPHLGKPADEIAAEYVAYKLKSRGERAAERARRQCAYARRVAPVVGAAMLERA